jgi:hypothetical protein
MNQYFRLRTVGLLMGCLLASAALAQGTSAGAQQAYESVFAGDSSSREMAAPTDWRSANRQAGDLGGFVGQMRASPSAAAAPSVSGEPASTGPERMRGMLEMMATLRSTGAGAGDAEMIQAPSRAQTPAAAPAGPGRRQ